MCLLPALQQLLSTLVQVFEEVLTVRTGSHAGPSALPVQDMWPEKRLLLHSLEVGAHLVHGGLRALLGVHQAVDVRRRGPRLAFGLAMSLWVLGGRHKLVVCLLQLLPPSLPLRRLLVQLLVWVVGWVSRPFAQGQVSRQGVQLWMERALLQVQVPIPLGQGLLAAQGFRVVQAPVRGQARGAVNALRKGADLRGEGAFVLRLGPRFGPLLLLLGPALLAALVQHPLGVQAVPTVGERCLVGLLRLSILPPAGGLQRAVLGHWGCTPGRRGLRRHTPCSCGRLGLGP
mmetsp:Transcript_136798/g.237605  ORF Transcript_136798/g.237605 Transcript_136798/m.237605 type:complete len:287 (+) Transcript_136798:738-1598(+)